jgi:hypothetical protein
LASKHYLFDGGRLTKKSPVKLSEEVKLLFFLFVVESKRWQVEYNKHWRSKCCYNAFSNGMQIWMVKKPHGVEDEKHQERKL